MEIIDEETFEYLSNKKSSEMSEDEYLLFQIIMISKYFDNPFDDFEHSEE